MRFYKKQYLKILLCLCMFLIYPSSTACAVGTAEGDPELVTVEGPWTDPEETYTSAPDYGTAWFSVDPDSAASGVTVKEGAYENWIDRIDVPQYAQDFYEKLVEACDNDGADDWLIDVAQGEKAGSGYVVTVTDFSGKADSVEAIQDEIVKKHTEINGVVRAVYDAFDRDHPEVFWLNGKTRTSAGYTYNKSDFSYHATVRFALLTENSDIRSGDYQSAETIRNAISERESRVSEIIGGAGTSGTYDTIRYLNRWLTENNGYNSTVISDGGNGPDSAHECLSALMGSRGENGPVCEGYSRAFKVLCDRMGIPCVLVDGYAKSSSVSGGEAHMWNYVMLGGKWYAVDVTWNDPIVSGQDGSGNENYLLLGSDTVVKGMKFIESHPVENRASLNGVCFVNGPVLENEKYIFTDMGDVLVGYTLSLTDQIGVNFYMELSGETAENKAAYMHFTLPDGSVRDVPVSEAKADTEVVPGKTCYVFSCGVAAKEMNDEIKAQMVISGEEMQYGREYTYTVRQYAEYLLGRQDANGQYAKVANLVKAMLNYGSYAQKYFKYHTDNLANNSSYMGEEEKEVSFVTADVLKDYSNPGVQENTLAKLEGSSLSLLSKTTLRLYFTITEGTDPESLTFACDGRKLEKMKAGSYYYVDITDIAAKDLNKTQTVTISDGVSEGTVEYNVMAYCYNVLSREETAVRTRELKDVIAALYLYNQKAGIYFGE